MLCAQGQEVSLGDRLKEQSVSKHKAEDHGLNIERVQFDKEKKGMAQVSRTLLNDSGLTLERQPSNS